MVVSNPNSPIPFYSKTNSNLSVNLKTHSKANTYLSIKSSRFLFPSFFVKPIFISINMLLMSNVNIVSALNATTSKEIHGSAPYLTFDSGMTKINDTNSLLGISLSSGTIIKANDDVSSITNPIELPQTSIRFSDIKTVVPLPTAGNSDYPRIDLNQLIGAPYYYFGDAETGASATGSVTIKWEDSADNDITASVKANPTGLLSTSCTASYKITVKSTSGELSTRYGIPNTSTFDASEHIYYIKPNRNNMVPCSVEYAQPNLAYDNTSWGDASVDMDGPTWFANKGYKVLSTSNSGNYKGASSIIRNNFPSTGAHNLFFYLLWIGYTN